MELLQPTDAAKLAWRVIWHSSAGFTQAKSSLPKPLVVITASLAARLNG
ncbi:MAG TPA: hypothetical protein VJS44_04105 [Pyrinomonadaceae bacterium]|nr:hypothetical protein [Pyrinomonadaceae bacterium]